MPIPDVLGLKLDEALRVLAAGGWKTTVTMTYPPRRENVSAAGPARVLRVTGTGEYAVELIAAYTGAGEGCSGSKPGKP